MGNKLNPTFIPTDGLVAYYKLDGDATDSSGNGNNGTATNVTWTAAERGYVEEAGSFNGSSSKISIPISTFYITSEKTMSAWVKGISSGGAGKIIANAGLTGDNPVVVFSVDYSYIEGDGDQSDNCAFNYTNDGKWHLLTTTIDIPNKLIKTYLDGVFQNQVTIPSNNTQVIPTTYSNIGVYTANTGTPGWADGDIGNIFIYNKALSQQEITTLYEEGLKQFGPTALFNRSQGFPKYSLSNLEQGKVLEISRPANGGVYYDQTGNGNNSTSVTSVTDSTVGLNNVMSFTGGTSAVGINTTGQSAVDKAICFNIKPGEANSTSNIKFAMSNVETAGNRQNPSWSYNHTNSLFANAVYVKNTSGTNFPCKFNMDFVVGKWYNIILQINGTNIELYVDGVLKNSLSYTGTLSIPDRINIGGDTASGIICDFSEPIVYNRALSAEEIQQLYYSNKII